MLIPLCIGLVLGACSPAPKEEITQDSLRRMFVEVCEYANVDCSDTKVKYYNLSKDLAGMALLYNTGKKEVVINKIYKFSVNKTREILVHEVAHLVVFENHPPRIHSFHGPTFNLICHDLVRKTSVSHTACHR